MKLITWLYTRNKEKEARLIINEERIETICKRIIYLNYPS